MKLGSPFYIILTIAFILTAIGLIVNDMNITYYDAGIANSTLMTKYNYVNDINDSFSSIITSANKIGEDSGWWNKIISGGIVIFLALITTINMILNAIPMMSSITSGIGTDLKIPQELVSIGIIAIVGAFVIMIVKFVHRGQS